MTFDYDVSIQLLPGSAYFHRNLVMTSYVGGYNKYNYRSAPPRTRILTTVVASYNVTGGKWQSPSRVYDSSCSTCHTLQINLYRHLFAEYRPSVRPSCHAGIFVSLQTWPGRLFVPVISLIWENSIVKRRVSRNLMIQVVSDNVEIYNAFIQRCLTDAALGMMILRSAEVRESHRRKVYPLLVGPSIFSVKIKMCIAGDLAVPLSSTNERVDESTLDAHPTIASTARSIYDDYYGSGDIPRVPSLVAC